MKLRLLPPSLLSLALMTGSAAALDDDAYVRENGTALFEDHFDRQESAPDKEEIGNGWTTNTPRRAGAAKQAALEDGALHVTRSAAAGHSVALFHDVAFQDGAVRLRFKFDDPGDILSVEFTDRQLKTVHAGHLCDTRFSLKGLTLIDQKTGVMDNAIHERLQAGDNSPELAELLKTRNKSFPLDLRAGEWHTLLVVVEGDVLRVTIDAQPVGEFKSPGLAHPTKRALVLDVDKSAWIDDVKVWNLKCPCEE